MNREIDLLVLYLDQAFDRRSWHGPNLRGSLRQLDPEEASFRPGPGRHNVWELAVHAAYWKYAVLRRITKEKRGSFPLRGSNWFTRPGADATREALGRDLGLLIEMHERLRETVLALAPRRLDEKTPGKKYTVREMVAGVAAHDLYHAGQIRLLKTLSRRG